MKVESPRTLPGSVTESTAADSAVKVAMAFRLWASASAGPEDGQTANAWRQNPGVLALIEDAAASKRGVVVAGDDHVAVSGLQESVDALVLSRQIQHGLRGLRGHAGAAAVALSIVIDFSGGPAPAVTENALQKSARLSLETANEPPEISRDLVSLLAISKPAQVLITHDLLQQITAIKGLPLKSFPGRFGVYEYLWTGDDELELLQSEPQLKLAAIHSAVPAGAAAKELKDATTGTIGAATVRNELLHEEKKQQQLRTVLPLRPALWFGILATAIMAAIAIASFVFFHAHPSAPRTTATPALASPPSPGTNNSLSQVPESRHGESSHANSRNKGLSAFLPRLSNGRQKPAAPVDASAESSPATVAAPPQPCRLPGEINKYASLAESRREQGDYAGAVRLFREVLDCDPNNAQAREGLNRAIQAQGQNH